MDGSALFRIGDFVVYRHFDSVSPVSLDGWLEILMLGQDVCEDNLLGTLHLEIVH